MTGSRLLLLVVCYFWVTRPRDSDNPYRREATTRRTDSHLIRNEPTLKRRRIFTE